MIDVHQIALTQTKKVIKEALQHFATEEKGNELKPHQVKIIVGTKCPNLAFNPGAGITDDNQPFDVTNTEPYYFVLKNDQPYMRVRKNDSLPNGQEMTAEVTFNQILNVKFDLLGKGALAKAFMSEAIARFSTELQTDPRNVEIMLLSPAEIEPQVEAFALLFDNGKEDDPFVRQLDWEKDIFVKSDQIDAEIASNS
jgi:hypothetical protein